jgi:hypothetical protein
VVSTTRRPVSFQKERRLLAKKINIGGMKLPFAFTVLASLPAYYRVKYFLLLETK